MFRAIHSNGAYNASEIKQTAVSEELQIKLRQLGDLELAVLICLIAQEHCMFASERISNRDLRDELQHICSRTFGLQCVVVQCSAKTTVDEFSEAILVDTLDDEEVPVQRSDLLQRPTMFSDVTSSRGRSPSRFGSNTLDTRRIADAIIAVDLDLAPESVQVQALELMRARRIFTRTALHTASKNFTMLSIVSKPGARLSLHLNDLFCMCHVHAEQDGLPYVDADVTKDLEIHISADDVGDLRSLAEDARFTPEIAAYLHNIVVFMRNNRFIMGGVTASATRQLRAIAKTLAPLHGLAYVPPSLVVLAVRKVYPHRLKLTTVQSERSLQWGSNPEAIRELLNGVTIDDAIEDVLASVETPL